MKIEDIKILSDDKWEEQALNALVATGPNAPTLAEKVRLCERLERVAGYAPGAVALILGLPTEDYLQLKEAAACQQNG